MDMTYISLKCRYTRTKGKSTSELSQMTCHMIIWANFQKSVGQRIVVVKQNIQKPSVCAAGLRPPLVRPILNSHYSFTHPCTKTMTVYQMSAQCERIRYGVVSAGARATTKRRMRTKFSPRNSENSPSIFQN